MDSMTSVMRAAGRPAADDGGGWWSAVPALARLQHLRDGYTAGHADDVVALCEAVGRRLGLDEHARVVLDAAARLHDIGKVGVPDVILNKPGPLTDGEWQTMRRHPEWGAEVVQLLPGTEEIAAAVRGHHEHWSGNGYPDGLAATEIPLAARIIAVADAWHAMTSDRSYRRALDLDDARHELENGAGTQFDPDVTDAFLAYLEARAEPRFLRPAGKRAHDHDATRSRSRARALGNAIERVKQLPILRESVTRVQAFAATPGEPLDRLVEIVEADPALCVAVLREARRTAGSDVLSIPTALTIIGPEHLSRIVAGRSTIDYFQYVAGWRQPPEHLRLHAIATQRAVELIVRAQHREDGDALLIGALLHDVGKLVLEQAYPNYPRGVHGEAETPDSRAHEERRHLGLDHAMVGGVILRRWDVPDQIAALVETHHSATAEGPAAVLRLADMIANYAHAQPVDPKLMEHAATAAGLTAEQLRTTMFDMSRPPTADKPRVTEPSPFTRGETRALRGLAAGLTYKEIAAEHGLSPSTIRSQCHSIYTKLGVSDRSQAVLRATTKGWI